MAGERPASGTTCAHLNWMGSPLAIALLVAQATSPAAEPPTVQLHGWVDVFYGLNANRPADGTSFLPGTGTTARRANELNLNAAAVDVSLDPRPVGFHLTLAFGSGPEVVHSAEPGGSAVGPDVWRNVYQATVSYTAPIGSGLLFEAGIYPSHIGFESFFSKDDWNYTRGWMGEFSPYYQAGLKLAYSFDSHWSAQLHFLNGWQVIGDNNRAKAVGTQIAWTNDRVTLGFNTFAGPELPGDDSHWRLFGDLTAVIKATPWLSLGATADAGRQDRVEGAAVWHAAGLYARIALHPRAARRVLRRRGRVLLGRAADPAQRHRDPGSAPGRALDPEARGAARPRGHRGILGAARNRDANVLAHADTRDRQRGRGLLILATCKDRRRRGLHLARRAGRKRRQDRAGGGDVSGMADAPHRGMIDFLLVLAAVAFFAGSWAYVRFCARLGGAS